MIKESLKSKTAVVLASITVLGLGGAAIATATGVAPGGQSEQQDSVTGQDADLATAAAEQATGGKATDVERGDVSTTQDNAADTSDKGEFQTPANTA